MSVLCPFSVVHVRLVSSKGKICQQAVSPPHKEAVTLIDEKCIYEGMVGIMCCIHFCGVCCV